ncbi:outer membrane lipoprotein-sorting protein [Ottowia sp.]|uniref:outer membrane lipoprotein-sorting protein n=1 Tax=Ottowia sp. TaxID=1898956 RepID=UPI0025E945EC|nr:outer membrane lipoprotein-sorting protein [Ottowia sp.]MBK6616491.1 outer membrane lipoprotein-sorting protein [Ottowia sp.]
MSMRFKRIVLVGATLLAACPVLALAETAGDILKAADRFRASSVDMRLDTSISTFDREGKPLKDRLYTVYAQSRHRSLVIMQSPSEKGQKVLMLGDDFWLIMPGSARPMRITPMQKLLGDASTGDVATMSWSEDYSAQIVGEEQCDGAACTHLRLDASRKGVTYQRIELWVGKERRQPIRADLYVQSDKLAKQARFVMDKPGAPTAVAEMVLADKLSNHRETRIRYLARKERTVPEAWLNPMFLASTASLDE